MVVGRKLAKFLFTRNVESQHFLLKRCKEFHFKFSVLLQQDALRKYNRTFEMNPRHSDEILIIATLSGYLSFFSLASLYYLCFAIDI